MKRVYKQILDVFISEQEIDTDEIESYNPSTNTFDKNEEFCQKCKKAIEKIKEDGLWEWTNIPEPYLQEAISYIKEVGEQYE